MAEEYEDGVERRVERDGRVVWLLYGILHRDGGPAVQGPNGEQRHREDGPASQGAGGSQSWYLNGETWNDGPSIVARQRAERARTKPGTPGQSPVVLGSDANQNNTRAQNTGCGSVGG